MKRVLPVLVILVFASLLSGCLTVFVPVGTPTPIPTALSLPTQPQPTAALQTVAPTQAGSASVCSVDPLVTACGVPQVTVRDKICTKKIPYVLLAAPPGVKFEPVSPNLKCTDEGIRGGDQIISCTGPALLSYDLKVCNASCSASLLDTTTGKCPSGYGYSADAGCCWPVPTTDMGCTVVKVDVGACD